MAEIIEVDFQEKMVIPTRPEWLNFTAIEDDSYIEYDIEIRLASPDEWDTILSNGFTEIDIEVDNE